MERSRHNGATPDTKDGQELHGTDSVLSRRTFAGAALAVGATAAASAVMPVRSAHAESLIGALQSLLFGTQGEGAAEAASTPAVADASAPLARPGILQSLQGATYTTEASVPDMPWAADLSNVYIPSSVYLNNDEYALLSQYGFAVSRGSFDEYFELYESNRYNLVPNFVTVDAMMHTYHLYFARLLKMTEYNYLQYRLYDLSMAMLARTSEQLEALAGTEWEEAAFTATAFFATAALMLDGATAVPAAVFDVATAEARLAYDHAGTALSPLTGANEDYTQYTVRGYYAGDAALENYFRAMMWYGRLNFTQSDEKLDRAALLITLALDEQSLPLWETIYAVTSFFVGAADDNGYYEYRPLIDAAYGPDATVSSLVGNTAAWDAYHVATGQTPTPKINSIPILDEADNDLDDNGGTRGFRFMGQRFSIDAAVFEQLVYDNVGPTATGECRGLPSALDIPAAFGSEEALNILNSLGAGTFDGFAEQMQTVRDGIARADDTLWTASLYSQWLRTLKPLLEVRGAGYPDVMRTQMWTRKRLSTFLGSYTELKHDTVLYSKQVMAEAGGGPLDVIDDRGYVEPEPEVFGRLSALVAATSAGLASLGVIDESATGDLAILQSLADQLQLIAQKELRCESPTDDEYELIRSFGAQIEHFWQQASQDDAGTVPLSAKEFPAPIVVDVATDAQQGIVLELATGKVARIKALVPIDGTLHVVEGGAYTFYQFAQPMDQRLTDTQWRQMMGYEPLDDGSYMAPTMIPDIWSNDYMWGLNY